MKPASFNYVRPSSRDEALAALQEAGMEGKVLAGGQSLVPLMNLRLAHPETVVDINKIADLDYAHRSNGTLAIGATFRQETGLHEPAIADAAPLMTEALAHVAHTQIRHRGTVLGSLAHADPVAELPAVALALDARLRLDREGSSRTVEAADFFAGPFMTVLEPEELLTEVSFRVFEGRYGHAFVEFARKHGDFAIVAVAAVVGLSEGGSCSDARIALAGVGDRPLRVRAAEEAVTGRRIDARAIADAAQEVAVAIHPPSDIHGTSRFRRTIAVQLVQEAIERAHARAQGRA